MTYMCVCVFGFGLAARLGRGVIAMVVTAGGYCTYLGTEYQNERRRNTCQVILWRRGKALWKGTWA